MRRPGGQDDHLAELVAVADGEARFRCTPGAFASAGEPFLLAGGLASGHEPGVVGTELVEVDGAFLPQQLQDGRELRQVEVHVDGAVDGVDDRGCEWRPVGVEVGVAAKGAGLVQQD